MFEKEAEEYARKNLSKDCCDLKLEVYKKTIQVYIAGATENCVQWHDLRKDPNDLPTDYRSVWTNKGGACHDNFGWYDDFGWVNGVIAWCEPQFEEEKQC